MSKSNYGKEGSDIDVLLLKLLFVGLEMSFFLFFFFSFILFYFYFFVSGAVLLIPSTSQIYKVCYYMCLIITHMSTLCNSYMTHNYPGAKMVCDNMEFNGAS